MEVSILKQGTGAAEISLNERKLLAVTTNLNSKIYKQISRQELLSKPGLLIKNGIPKKWECTDSIVHEEKLIFPGLFYEGNTLADTNIDIDILLELAISFQIIIKDNFPVSGFYTPGILKLNNGGILFFPPELINYTTSQLSEKESTKYWQPYNHPEAKGNSQYSFTLGILAYKLLTKELPYTGTTITEIREKMRSSKPVSIEILKPGIQKSIAVLIDNALSLKDIELSDWIEQLRLWKENGISNLTEGSEKLRLEETAEKKQNDRQRQFKRKQFLSHHWKTIAAIAAGAVFIISISIGPIKNALEPPITTGMTAKEVVRTYYNAITDMDVEIMEDCIEKNAGKNDINEVTQLFVISRVRTGYEGKSGLISAQDWNDGIVTVLEPGEQVYGIANLKITKIDESFFHADYIKWYPNIPEDTESTEILPPIKIYVTDELTLAKVKEVWIIINLNRKTTE